MKKWMLVAGALLFAGLPVAYGRSYEVVFAVPVQAGNVELAPGAYTIRHRGDEAIFTKVSNQRTYDVPATVEWVARKNRSMDVVLNNQNAIPQIQRVVVGGHRYDLQFGQ